MKPDLVPWGNWFQSPSSYGFSCWQDWFEGEPNGQRQLPLLRRTLKEAMMTVNRLCTHTHTKFYNKLVGNSFPQHCTWDWHEEETGGSLWPIVEETKNPELAGSPRSHGTANCSFLKRKRHWLTIYACKYQIPMWSKGSYTKAVVTSGIFLVYVLLPDQAKFWIPGLVF